MAADVGAGQGPWENRGRIRGPQLPTVTLQGGQGTQLREHGKRRRATGPRGQGPGAQGARRPVGELGPETRTHSSPQ